MARAGACLAVLTGMVGMMGLGGGAAAIVADKTAGNTLPGSTAYPNGSMRRIEAATGQQVFGTEAPVPLRVALDAGNGYLFSVTGGTFADVVKISVGAGDLPPRRVGALSLLAPGEGIATCEAIDAEAGFLYVGTTSGSTAPQLLKLAVGAGEAPPTRAASLSLDAGEMFLLSGVIDSAAGYGYFATGTTPARIVKVALGAGGSPPQRVATLTLNSGENFPYAALIDPARKVAYFACEGNPARIVKIALGDGDAAPTRVGAATLASGEEIVRSGVLDAANGHAYFGATGAANSGRIVKVGLGATADAAPARLNALALAPGEAGPSCAVIDPAAGIGYFGISALGNGGVPGSTQAVIKVALGAGNDAPTRVATTLLVANGSPLPLCAAVDAGAGRAYFVADGAPYSAFELNLAVAAGEAADVVTSSTVGALEVGFSGVAMDAGAGYAYAPTALDPAGIVKFSLSRTGKTLARVGALSLNPGESYATAVALDVGNSHGYVTTDDAAGGHLVKFALGSGDAPPTRIGAATLGLATAAEPRALALDTVRGYAYVATSGYSPGRVLKLALGAGTAAPALVATTTLQAGENDLSTVLVDEAAGHIYVSTRYDAGRIIKLAAGVGDAAPVRLGAATFLPSEVSTLVGALDPVAGYAYYGMYYGQVVKVALGAGTAAPSRVGAGQLLGYVPGGVAIDSSAGYIYFAATSEYPPRRGIERLALGAGSAAPTQAGIAQVGRMENNPRGAILDPAGNSLYVATQNLPGRLVRIGLDEGQFGYLKATRFTISEAATVQEVRFYRHAAEGSLRLALYDNAEPKTLLWQSDEVPNTGAPGEIGVAISSGTPATLKLAPGSYWAAWEVDSREEVPSYSAGEAGEGFYAVRTFGDLPTSLAADEITTSTERWTQYIRYSPASDGVLWLVR